MRRKNFPPCVNPIENTRSEKNESDKGDQKVDQLRETIGRTSEKCQAHRRRINKDVSDEQQ